VNQAESETTSQPEPQSSGEATEDDARAALKAVQELSGTDKAKLVLQKFEVEKVSQVAAGDRQAFVDACNVWLSAAKVMRDHGTDAAMQILRKYTDGKVLSVPAEQRGNFIADCNKLLGGE
jgi:hypothetical protein